MEPAEIQGRIKAQKIWRYIQWKKRYLYRHLLTASDVCRVVPSCGSQAAVRRAIILNNEPICIHLLNTGTAGITFRYICAIQLQRYRTLPCRFDCRAAAHLNVHIEKCHQLRFSPIRFNRNRILGHGTGNHNMSKRPVFAGKSPVQDRQNSRIF